MSQVPAENIVITIKRIKQISFFIDEQRFIVQKLIKIDLALQLAHIIDKSLVQFLTRISYNYADDSNPSTPLVDILVQNVFEIKDLAKYVIRPSIIKLPPNTIISLVSLSISHTRALLAVNLSGTVYQENILGILNPEDAAKHFFPEMFNESLPNIPIVSGIDPSQINV